MLRERIKISLLVHDLKVPLAVIESGITSLLQSREKYGSLTPMQEKALSRVLRNTKVLRTLVNDILELGKSGQGKASLTKFKLSNLIEQSLVEIFDLVDRNTSEQIKMCTGFSRLRETLDEKGLSVLIDEDLWCEDLFLDEIKVKQILRNLLMNALKFRKSRVELEVDKKNDYLMLSVRDDGEGIPSIYHKKIFESYFQMDATESYSVRGHGLGLAGVMVLVEDMGGEMLLESDKGEGAKFLVTVPLANK